MIPGQVAAEKDRPPASPWRIGLMLVLAVFAINAMAAWWATDTLLTGLRDHENRAAVVTQNTAKAIDQAIITSVEKIDLTLRFLVDDLETQLKTRGRIEPGHMEELLDRQQARVPEMKIVLVTDADGRAFRRVDDPEPPINLSDRDHFRVHLASPDVGMSISPPVVGRMTKTWQVNFARRYNKPDGSFAGVVSAAVTLSHFSDVLAGPDLGPHGIALLRYSDGRLLVRYPSSNAEFGQVGAKGYSPELGEAMASGERMVTFHSKRTADGVERINTLRRIQGTPFMVLAGLATDDYLADWFGERNNMVVLGVGFCVVSLLGGALIWRLLARQWETGQNLVISNRELLSALEELERRNTEIARFTEVLAHHLQEPVRLQHAFAQRLQHLLPAPLSPDLERALGFIRTGALRQRALLRDVEHYLAITQSTTPPRPCDPKAALAEACRRLQEKITATGTVIHCETLPAVEIQSERLIELFAEVIDNAMEYRRDDCPPEIRIDGQVIDGQVRFSVADNGVGIPEQFRRRVFRVFERIAPRGEQDGTGIGLALVEKIVQAAHGRIWIEGGDSGGTKVIWTLPSPGA